MALRFILILTLAFALACDDEPEVRAEENPLASPPVGDRPVPETLSEWNLFADAASQTPKDDVYPFEVTAPLFTDHALKHRFLYVPPGEQITYSDDETKWEFPRGSVLIKTFAYPIDETDSESGEQLIETRLLVHEDSGWQPYVYEWNAASTRAERVSSGPVKSVSWIDASGETQIVAAYTIPTTGECRTCHATAPDTHLLGPSTAMLDRDNDFGDGPENQIDFLYGEGLLDRAPATALQRLQFLDPTAGDIAVDTTEKARAYLHTNCSHCHAPDGLEAQKELFFDWASTDPDTGNPFEWGACKEPTSAGNANCLQPINIVPGEPDESLMICRLEIAHPYPGPMPPLGRSVVHEEAVDLLAQWISDMSPAGCD
jgi:uncharacterized repeat protein (TIGR03806 family)